MYVGIGNGDENFQELWQTRKVYSLTNFCSILFICMFPYMNRNGNNGFCRITTPWHLNNSHNRCELAVGKTNSGPIAVNALFIGNHLISH